MPSLALAQTGAAEKLENGVNDRLQLTFPRNCSHTPARAVCFKALYEDGDGRQFRPRSVLAWADDPEQLYQRQELRALVERAVTSLPVPYRLAVLLRDLEQLSTAEAAAALGLGIPTLKTHLLRGRLMLREALAPHFVSRRGAVAGV